MKAVNIIKFTFMVIGGLMLVAAIWFYWNTQQFLQTAAQVEGVVVAFVESRQANSKAIQYAPVVRYVAQDGREVEFTSSVSSYPAGYDIGEKVPLLYLASEPEKAKLNTYFSLWGGATVLGILGLVFFSIGAAIMLFAKHSNRNEAYLKTNGEVIDTEFQHVARNESMTVNGTHPYQIITQWLNPHTSEVHVFKSKNIWFDPTQHIKTQKIKVYIQPNNPKRYHLDVSFLPKLAE